ncbi:hypothetical protein CTI12_AA321360 [Artemisia annua]|uniref:Uncharacterized protein n=1 Tax=Artemisia annua TaxID=35608 RepID=A0A2U1MYB6_ARTAN|nr:hypothetical protein CTI12_AA321360 [Artemisia annua]
MSNSNDKQPLDLTQSLSISDNAQAPSTTTQTVKKLDYLGINLVEMSSVKPREKNDSLGVPAINQRDVTTGNLSLSDEASTTTPTIDCITEVYQTPYDVDKSDDPAIGYLLDCAERGQILSNQRPPSICKVSRILRELSESSFTPQLVSIGPIHREDPKLQEFEWLKECYLNDLLKRFRSRSTQKKTLEECLLKVNTLIPQIRESYAGVIENYSDDKLATMMVMDGCFILEFCFKHRDRNLNFPNKMQALRIAMDLILLENQVPFFVLQALFDCFMGKSFGTLSQVLDIYLAHYIMLFRSRLPEKKSILSNVLDKYLAPYIKLFCSLLREKNSTTNVDSDLPKKNSTTDVDSDSTPAHVLGYMHKRYHLVGAKPSNIPASHSIVELNRSGMNFKPHQEDGWSMTIKFRSSLFACLPWFWSKPTLLMPTLVIQDTTELILRNFIAYEQTFPQDRYYFTSYACAMDMLIDTQEDIAKLVESKVLVNILGSNQEAADMINKICKNVLFTEFYYTEEFKQMDEYYNGLWPKNIARLRRVYFSNPWSIIALLAAIILFSLTVVQTIYTIRAA